MWTSFAVALATELPLLCCRPLSQQVPYNYLLLVTFTLAESYLVSFICVFYDPVTVAIAAGLTGFTTLALTLYALFTTKDFTFTAGALYLFSSALFKCTLLAIFLPANQILRLVISGVSVIVFGLYLIFDI